MVPLRAGHYLETSLPLPGWLGSLCTTRDTSQTLDMIHSDSRNSSSVKTGQQVRRILHSADNPDCAADWSRGGVGVENTNTNTGTTHSWTGVTVSLSSPDSDDQGDRLGYW